MAETPPIRVAGEQIDRLLEDVLNLPTTPIGEHMSDDECVGYVLGTLAARDIDQIDEHLLSCFDCTAVMERLLAAADAWQGEAAAQQLLHTRESLRTTLHLARTQLWWQVVGVVVFSAAHLARTRRQGMRFQADTLYQHWVSDELTCILAEDAEGFVFSVDTTDDQYADVVLRFALADAAMDEERVSGLLAMHPDPLNTGHYVAAARLTPDVTLPELCQPRLARLNLDASQPFNEETLSAAVAASYEEMDRQAWRDWAQREADAGRLPPAMAEAISRR